MKLTVAPYAQRDLQSIYNFIAENNEERAWSFVLELLDKADRLLEYPRMGVKIKEDTPNDRELHHKGYTLAYRIKPDEIVITEVCKQVKKYRRYGVK
jgi:plasmid stabilization system protein ParE